MNVLGYIGMRKGSSRIGTICNKKLDLEGNLTDIARRLEAIIEMAIDGIITIDSRGTVETMNQAAAKIFSYAPGEIIGRNIKVLMPEPDRGQHDQYLSNYLKTKKRTIIGVGREVKGKKKDGSLFPFRLAVSEVILNDRVIFTGVIHDLTEVKEAERKLIKANNELENKVEERTVDLEKAFNNLLETNQKLLHSELELKGALGKEKELNELKSRFVSMASHEFRTPLSTILSSASLISKYPETEQQGKREKHVNRIKSAVSNLTGILNDFLSLSKLEEGRVEVRKSRVVFQEICKEVIGEVEGILKTGQQIKLEGAKDISFETDPRILKNILFNILSNAIKYSKEEKTIRCLVKQVENELILTIVDQGIGIPKADQKFLFQRFFRASNVENIQGTGLGLNIVKRYVNLLGGKLDFESEEGAGTSIFIKIPI